MLFALMCQPASALLDSSYISMNTVVFDSLELLQVGNKQIDCHIAHSPLAVNDNSEFAIRWMGAFYPMTCQYRVRQGVTVVSQKFNLHI